MDAQKGLRAGFDSPVDCYAQHCNTRIVTTDTAQPRIDCCGEGGYGDS